MTATRSFFTVGVVMVASLAASPSRAETGSLDRAAQTALSLSRQAKEIYEIIRQHHQHQADYVRLQYDAAEVYHFAGHMHQVAWQGSDEHLESDLTELSYAFNHLKKLVTRMSKFGPDGRFGSGRREGGVDYLRDQMRRAEYTVERLRRDVRRLRDDAGRARTASSAGRAESPRTRYLFNDFRPSAYDVQLLIRQ